MITIDENKGFKFLIYFVCVDNITPHFVERGFVHVNEKINCILSNGTYIRDHNVVSANDQVQLKPYTKHTSCISSEGMCGMKSFPVKKQIKMKSSISLSIS
jgi:hypothetical protein